MCLTPQHRLFEAGEVNVDVGRDGLEGASIQRDVLKWHGKRAEGSLPERVKNAVLGLRRGLFRLGLRTLWI